MTALLFMATPPSEVWAQATPVEAPDAERRQVVPFLDGTDVFLHVPRNNIIFEADIQPHLVVSQNFSDKLVIEESLTGQWRYAYSVVGTPRVRLRMIDERSAPVRTPSYMPRGSVLFFFFRGERENVNRVGIWSPELTVGHHSNGQDGCLYTTDVLVGDDCIGPADPTNINVTDGSFSTNFVRLGGYYRREWLSVINPGRADEEYVGKSQMTISLHFDQHFKTEERLEPFYGQSRARSSIAFSRKLPWCKSRAAASLTLYYVGTPPENVPSWAYQADAVCTFTPQGGWGAFARYFDGQDYYNLGFATHLRRFVAGVRYDQDGFLRFITAAAKQQIDEQRRQRDRR